MTLVLIEHLDTSWTGLVLCKKENILFISFKEGFDRDIMKSTISAWIKQTLLLDNQPFNSGPQDLHFEAHIRSMSACLVFKAGVSSEQILGSCYWKTHNSLPHST